MAGGYQNGNSDLSSWQDDYGLTGQRAPSPYDSISSLTGLAPPKQVVSRQPVGPGSGYSLVTHNDGSTEYQDANGNPVPPSYARYSVPASTVGQSSTGTVNRPQGGPSVPSGNYGGPQSGASTVGSGQTVSSIASSGRSPRASDLPSVDNLLRLKETVQAPIGQSGLPGRSIAAASTGVAAGNGGNPSGAHPSGLGGPRFHGISFDPELRAVVPVEQSGPKVVSERPYSSNSKEQVYDNSTRKIFWNNHKLAAIGKSIPSVDRTQQGYQYIPAAGFEHVQNPLWGTPGTDLYRDAAQFKGVRKLIYDPGTHLTTALFYDPRPGAVYYSGGNHTRGPAEGGGISTAHTYYEGGKRALSEAGNDIVLVRRSWGRRSKRLVSRLLTRSRDSLTIVQVTPRHGFARDWDGITTMSTRSIGLRPTNKCIYRT